MISIGNFEFPTGKSFAEVRTVETLSRVRKELTLHALLDGFSNINELFSKLESLERAVEELDRSETVCSLQSGRYYKGKRRDYIRLVHENLLLTTVKLVILTDDRFERGTALKTLTQELFETHHEFSVSQEGNWRSMPRVKISAIDPLVNPVISTSVETISYSGVIGSGEYLIYDSETHTAVKNGALNVLSNVTGSFPLLQPGNTILTYDCDDVGGKQGSLLIEYRDTWV